MASAKPIRIVCLCFGLYAGTWQEMPARKEHTGALAIFCKYVTHHSQLFLVHYTCSVINLYQIRNSIKACFHWKIYERGQSLMRSKHENKAKFSSLSSVCRSRKLTDGWQSSSYDQLISSSAIKDLAQTNGSCTPRRSSQLIFRNGYYPTPTRYEIRSSVCFLCHLLYDMYHTLASAGSLSHAFGAGWERTASFLCFLSGYCAKLVFQPWFLFLASTILLVCRNWQS